MCVLRSEGVPRINIDLSDDSLANWHAFARRHGMTLAALLEVMGRHIDDSVIHARVLKRIEEEGRDLAHERRRKGGPRRKAQPDA